MNLIAIALLRARAAASGIVELNQKGQTLTVKLGVFDFAAISSLCEEASFKGRVFFAAGKTPAITVKLKSGEDALKLAQLLVDRYCLLGTNKGASSSMQTGREAGAGAGKS